MRGLLLALCLPFLLGACSSGPYASDEAVARAAYRDDGPPTITLFTMINNRTGGGAHSALMVSGSQRIIFNPAGTFNHPYLPQRGDTFFGMTDSKVDFFVDYHARSTYRVVRHDVVVTPEQAEIALQRVLTNGAVPNALCTTSIGRTLRDVPGFETAPTSPFPTGIMRYFDQIPGVKIRRYYDDSPDDRSDGVTDTPAARADIIVEYGPDRGPADERGKALYFGG